MTRQTNNVLLGGLDLTEELIELWSDLPGVMFAIKDYQGRYVAVNDAFVRRSSASQRAQVLGHTAHELFLPDLADRYEAQDLEVMRTGKPMRGELEVIRAKGGTPAWHLTTKLPLVRQSAGGKEAVGVVTISTELAALGSSDQIGASLTKAVALVRSALCEPVPRLPTVSQLAAAAGVAVSTLERNMIKVFGVSAKAYVLQQRIDLAMSLLGETDLPISQVATRAGFYDQPSLTRQLVRMTGETPGGFRRRARAVAAS
jgi:AraC-like DNA-binding protein